ncbi:MAG: glycoside hydrolase family 43 protein [Acidimicrobiia bacterium]|nr:glycoside hydrolase family 43 protein [Acidimicrobiia bacterium]
MHRSAGRLVTTTTALAVVIAAYLGVQVHQYWRALSFLHQQQQLSTRAIGSLGTAKETVALTAGEIRSTRDESIDVRTLAERRVRERDVLLSGLEATRAGLVDAETRLSLTETAVFVTRLHQLEVAGCLDGVAAATEAVRLSDNVTAVAALSRAAPACSAALTAATGSRFPFDFADPAVLLSDGVYYAYSTNAGVGDIQVIRSADLSSWEIVGNGLAALPGWAEENWIWAPFVAEIDGTFIAYYTTRERESTRQCISRAIGVSPAGPFVDDSEAPLVCQLEHGGSIDPSAHLDDDGRTWLTWKSEGLGAEPQSIWSQRLSRDGERLVGSPSRLVVADQDWEHGVVEGPSMFSDSGRWYLFYSGGDWKTREYAVGYALCDGPAGPCVKPAAAPILASDGRIAGPGGQELFRDTSGESWMAFHAYTEPDVGYPSSRTLHLLRVGFTGGAPAFEAGT